MNDDDLRFNDDDDDISSGQLPTLYNGELSTEANDYSGSAEDTSLLFGDEQSVEEVDIRDTDILPTDISSLNIESNSSNAFTAFRSDDEGSSNGYVRQPESSNGNMKTWGAPDETEFKRKQKEKKEEEKSDSRLNEIFDWIRVIFIGVLIGVLLVVFVVQRNNVYGESMEPTLYSGNVVFAEKISTYFNKYERGDIVILDGENMTGYNHEEYLIKRIIGLPGETVRIADGNVYIKFVGSTEFVQLQEDYLNPNTQTTCSQIGLDSGYNEITLGEDEYYCLGDNRPVSNDSRTLGPFTEDRIKGIAFILAYPFSSFGLI